MYELRRFQCPNCGLINNVLHEHRKIKHLTFIQQQCPKCKMWANEIKLDNKIFIKYGGSNDAGCINSNHKPEGTND